MSDPTPAMRRGADIRVEQLPSGYWLGVVTIAIPGWPTTTYDVDSFHNVIEALEWARGMIENAVLNANA